MSLVLFPKLLYRYPVHRKLVLLFMALTTPLAAQIFQPGTPQGLPAEKRLFSYYSLPHADYFEPMVQAGTTDRKIARIGKEYQVQIPVFERATWIAGSQGEQTGYLGLVAAHASSLALSFSSFRLQPGCKIFVYNPSVSVVYGAFTFRNNKTTEMLSLAPMPGDSVIIEIQLTAQVDRRSDLQVSSVGVGWAGSDKGRFGLSASCHVNVNCLHDSLIQNQKYAACRLYTVRNDTGIYCSGTLINSDGNQGIPYFLTAGHCIQKEYDAHRSVILFDYESPFCHGPEGQAVKSISGAFLKARSDDMDFALLELSELPPVQYYPLYAGWNISNSIPSRVYSIHHPEGDVKKIAVDSNVYQDNAYDYSNELPTWQVSRYELGTTESGSSGAALYNEKNQVIGLLSGGDIACSEYINDYYQKLSFAWNALGDAESELQSWLDPNQKNMVELDGYNPFSGLFELLQNGAAGARYDLKPYAPWGYASGHNARFSRSYLEHFYRNGTKYLYAVTLKVGKAYAASSESYLNLVIREGNNDIPGGVLFEKKFYISEFQEGITNYLRLDTLIPVDGNFYVGYTINYHTPVDTFAVVLTTEVEQNSAFMHDNDGWYPLREGRSVLQASLGIFPHALDYYPHTNDGSSDFMKNGLTLYPNPANDFLQLLFTDPPDSNVGVKVFDVYGRCVLENQYIDAERNLRLDLHSIRACGVYFVQIQYGGTTMVEKFICLR